MVAKEEAHRADQCILVDVLGPGRCGVDLDSDGGAVVIGERVLAHTEEELLVPRGFHATSAVRLCLELVRRIHPRRGVCLQMPP